MLTPGIFTSRALAEINRQFSELPQFDVYDLVINGAGLQGYFAAIGAAKKGLKVLITDKRSSPGYEIAAKYRLWIGKEGFDSWDNDLIDLFFPGQEQAEIGRQGGEGPNKSLFGDELLLMSGTVRKGMLRNLLLNGVHLLLMTDICGVFSANNRVSGVLMASKHGLFSVKCKNFIDASDNVRFTKKLAGQDITAFKAGFVMELLNVNIPEKKDIEVPAATGVLNNKLILHPGKNAENQVLLEFEFSATGIRFEEIEMRARQIAAGIGKYLTNNHHLFNKAKVHEYASECSISTGDKDFPIPSLSGYFILQGGSGVLTCKEITRMQKRAAELAGELNFDFAGSNYGDLLIAGSLIPFQQIKFESAGEPGLSIPLERCSFPVEKYIKGEERFEVVIAGAGTSGITAAFGASEKGAGTVVVEYFNDPGGTKTLGGVMGYYHGIKDNPFINELEDQSARLTEEIGFTKRAGRKIYLAGRFEKSGGRFIAGTIICGSLIKNKKTEGILCCKDGRLFRVTGNITVDATGDADIAAFAGVLCYHGEKRAGITQNYSQWNITGGNKSPSYPSSDYDLIDISRISELQRGLFLSHYEAHFYNFYPYLTVRESRRIKGLYELNLIDAVEGTHFDDVISAASSDYDPHYFGNSEFTRCGFLLPHSNVVRVEIPYRSVVPDTVDGLLVVGKAFSQSQSTMQFTRMSGDLSILGYHVGQIAADISAKNISVSKYDVSELQKEWFLSGAIPEEFSVKKSGNKLNDFSEINRRIENLALGKPEYLYDCCRLPKGKALPLLTEVFAKANEKNGKVLIAKTMAWFGEPMGNALIAEELEDLFKQEQLAGYPEGYIENYDFIRGREKNLLEGIFWRINQNIALLGLAPDKGSVKIIRHILERTGSGGKMIEWTGNRADYFNSRIDLKIIPFYNRIINLCFYAERNPDSSFCRGLEKLLKDENIGGYITTDYNRTRWRVYGGNLEINIASALARCGSKAGYELLLKYLEDIHFNFKYFASSELGCLTGKKFGYDAGKWKKHLAELRYPRPCRKLVKDKEY